MLEDECVYIRQIPTCCVITILPTVTNLLTKHLFTHRLLLLSNYFVFIKAITTVYNLEIEEAKRGYATVDTIDFKPAKTITITYFVSLSYSINIK